jgi:hypothetical protein
MTQIYLSHKITGETQEQQDRNCVSAKAFATGLRYHFPAETFYVPAESEPFVSRAFIAGFLTVDQILKIDCDIINGNCNGAIFYTPDGKLSNGMQVEFNYCQLCDIPWIIVKDLAIDQLKQFFKQLEV